SLFRLSFRARAAPRERETVNRDYLFPRKGLGRCPADAAEADGVAGQAGVGKTGGIAEPVRRTQRVGLGFPRPAAEDVFLAVGWPVRVRLRADLVITLVVDVLTPLGDV